MRVHLIGASDDEARRVASVLAAAGIAADVSGADTGSSSPGAADGERFRALVEHAPDLFAILDADGTVLYEAPGVENVLGFRPDERVGSNVFDEIHPSDREAVAAVFQRAMASNPRTTLRVDYRMRHKDGSWRYLESIGTNLLDDPAVRGIVVNSRDISERKRIESQLEQAQRHAALGRLAGMVAHEFNNVLMGIQSFAEIVERHAAATPPLQQAADHIQGSIRRGRTITQEILRFTRPRELKVAEIDVHRWLEGARTELASLLRPEQTLRIVADTPLFVLGDEGQLAQALTNLVHNARDAMGPTGTVTIEAHPADDIGKAHRIDEAARFVAISVRDGGEGIPADVLGNIFDPLFTTRRGATGLGLTNVRLIAERHGGLVVVDSEQGKGSAFHLLVPRVGLSERTDETAGATHPAGTTPSAQRNRVLLVEDDPSVGPGIMALLEMEGFTTEIVETGGACIPAVRSFRPDVVVLDVGLPDVDGLKVYQELMDLWPSLPVVLSTGHGDRGRIDQVRHGARFGFLQKPYPIDELITLIRDLTR